MSMKRNVARWCCVSGILLALGIACCVISERLHLIPILLEMDFESCDKAKEDQTTIFCKDPETRERWKGSYSNSLASQGFDFDTLLATPFFTQKFVQYQFAMWIGNETNTVFNFYEDGLLRKGWVKVRGRSFFEEVLCPSETGVYEKDSIMLRLHRYGWVTGGLSEKELAEGTRVGNDVIFEIIGASVYYAGLGKKR